MVPVPQTIPETLPVMFIAGMSFFPHTLLPLYVFEERYLALLRDVSLRDGLFVIVGTDTKKSRVETKSGAIACIGRLSACEWHSDGTAHIIMQGVIRCRTGEVFRDTPYRVARVLPVPDFAGDTPERLAELGKSLRKLVARMADAATLPAEALAHIRDSGNDFIALADRVGAYLVRDDAFRRRLLECANAAIRLQLLQRHLRAEVGMLEFEKRLRGGLPEGIGGLN